MRRQFLLSLLLAALLIPAGIAMAESVPVGTPRSFIDRCQEDVDNSAAALGRLQVLIDEGSASPVDIEAYLYHSMVMVYFAKAIANHQFDVEETNEDLTALASLGYVPFWPENPISGKPMQVLSLADGFQAGELCLVLCPEEHFTTIGDLRYQMSYNLFVYALDPALEQFGDCFLHKVNRQWNEPPNGAMYGYSFYMMSDAEEARLADEIAAAQLKWQEEQANQ